MLNPITSIASDRPGTDAERRAGRAAPRARRPLVLVVDDDAANRHLLETLLLREGYRVLTAGDGPRALECAAAQPPDLVLLDVIMPEMNGFQVAELLRASPRTDMVPIVMVTGLNEGPIRMRGLRAGATDFVAKPIDPSELAVRLKNLLKLKEYGDLLAEHNRILERTVRERTRQLAESYREAIFTLSRAASYKDEETGEHVARVSHYTLELARELGLDTKFCEAIQYASPMHDVGKIAIPDAILGKPGRLEANEGEIMKTHARLGEELLAAGASPYLRMGMEIAGGHHERWDGGGYPRGLAGEAIPLPARIMQICDVYDALRSRRPYKTALSHETALEIITVGDGRTMPCHFDPQVLSAFERSAPRFRDIYATHADRR